MTAVLFDEPNEWQCSHCGAKHREHKHSLTKGLVSGLIRFAQHPDAPSPTGVNLREIGLTRNQWDNFQKLKYWGLVAHCGKKKSGVWRLTDEGRKWLSGRSSLHKRVITRAGKVTRHDGDLVRIDDIPHDPFYLKYEDYR